MIPDIFTNDARPRQKIRLGERFKRLINENVDRISGKRILDLASNNGRWSYAALSVGAKSVVGVEGRPELVEEARRLLTTAGAPPAFNFENDDIFDYLWSSPPGQFDTIFCFGIMYHVLDHAMFIKLMTKLKPECIIIDSGFEGTVARTVRFMDEDPSLYSNILPSFAGQTSALVGVASLGYIRHVAAEYGYRADLLPWHGIPDENRKAVHDYLSGRRFTLILTPDDPIRLQTDDWIPRWRAAIERSGLNPRNIIDKPLRADAEERERVLENLRKRNERIVVRGEL